MVGSGGRGLDNSVFHVLPNNSAGVGVEGGLDDSVFRVLPNNSEVWWVVCGGGGVA